MIWITCRSYLFAGFICLLCFNCQESPLRAADWSIPAGCDQLILGIAPDWNSSHATLSFWERDANGFWHKKISNWPARLGRNGLAWGRGISEAGESAGALVKHTGDGRSPAGVFALGDAYGYADTCPTKLAYHRVTEKDLWVEDESSRFYNAHAFTPHGGAPRNAWEKKQQMKQNDHAHSLKLFIEHNAPPHAVPGMGCSLFFHIWRQNGARPSSGCVVMPEESLMNMLKKLDPSKEPLLALLPKSIYRSNRKNWNLP